MRNIENKTNWRLDGARAPDILIVGHSHILALLSGFSELSQDQGSRFACLWSEDRTTWPQCSDEYWEIAADHPAQSIALVWNGNQHNAHFLLEQDPPLRIAGVKSLGQSKCEHRNAVVVSAATFEELWKAEFTEMKRVTSLLSQTKRCFIVGTPPPKDQFEIENLLHSDAFFIQKAAESGVTTEALHVSSNEFRLALYEQIQDGMREVAIELGVEFVNVPKRCIADSGLLAAGFGVPDATHSNGQYGAEVLRALLLEWEKDK